MPVICWSPLAKSAQDATTIAEYIAGRVNIHNIDPTAHGLQDYALYNHRDAETLDHIDGSVTMQKMFFNRFFIFCHFESIDAWQKTGNVILTAPGWVDIATPNNAYCNYSLRYGSAGFSENAGQPVNNPMFEAHVKFEQTTYQCAYVMAGDTSTPAGFGFMIRDNKINAIHFDNIGALRAVELGSYPVDQINRYRAEWIFPYGINFYINDIFQYSHRTRLELGGFGQFAEFLFKNSRLAVAHMYILKWLYQEDNFT